MAAEPTPCELAIDPQRVLWMTRGWRWERALVLVPKEPRKDEWFDALADIFLLVKTGHTPYCVSGVFTDERGPHGFLATCFLDPVRCDERHRPVEHRLVFFPPDEDVARRMAPADWGPRFVEAAGPALDAIFERSAGGRDDGSFSLFRSTRIVFERELARADWPLHVTGPGLTLYPVDIPSKHVPNYNRRYESDPPYPAPSFAKILLFWVAVFAFFLLLAFLQAH